MNSMVNYLLESGISLSLFAAVFLLFLRKETFFRTNRLFLLSSVIFSLILPLVAIPVYAPVPQTLPEVTVTPYRNLLEAVIISTRQISGNVENFVLSSRLLVNLWLTGVLVMTGIFIFRIVQIIRIIRKSRTENGEGYRLVLTGRDNPPFSFLHSLFVPENHTDIPGYDRIIRHELEHIRQGHTYDILLLDILLIFQWFNPFIWLLKRAVRENHEYLVDRAVLDSGVSPEEYKGILISQVAGNQVYAASHFNYSLLKNRFKMMTRIPSKRMARIKIIAGILIALALIVVFACEQKKKSPDQGAASNDTVSLRKLDTGFAISGNPEELKKISELLTSGKFEVAPENKNGTTFLVLKEKTAVSESEAAETNEVFTAVEKMPEFPGGQDSLRRFIAKSVEYPVEAAKKGIQGKVYVTFVVGKDGVVKNAKIIRGVSPMLDKEALRVINSLPNWVPGEQRGVKVNVAFTLPISFVLQ
jgi:TonB family protein